MIHQVIIAKLAQKQLKKVPARITIKLMTWVSLVKEDGLEEARKQPGYHDEPLRGKRRRQRSIRLSRHYRAIYEIRQNGEIEFVQIEEVTKHEY